MENSPLSCTPNGTVGSPAHPPEKALSCTPNGTLSTRVSRNSAQKQERTGQSSAVPVFNPVPRPSIVIDSREQTPFIFTRLPAIVGTLQTGDYSVAGSEEAFAIERKTVADFVGCCTSGDRERFERELHRLRGFRFKRLLIVGLRLEIEQHRYRSNIAPAAVLGSLDAWEVRYDVPVVWVPTPEAGAILIERWAHYFAREIAKQAASLLSATAAAPRPPESGDPAPAASFLPVADQARLAFDRTGDPRFEKVVAAFAAGRQSRQRLNDGASRQTFNVAKAAGGSRPDAKRWGGR